MTNIVNALLRSYDAVADELGFTSDPGMDGPTVWRGEYFVCFQMEDGSVAEGRVAVAEFVESYVDVDEVRVVWERRFSAPSTLELHRLLSEALEVAESLKRAAWKARQATQRG